jgi:light-regulated signal transduction histidine kinase (bacteriophytochrome)
VSHDLRAPLRHIVGFSDLLKQTQGVELGETGLRYLKNIGDAAVFAGLLVDNLLSFSQMGRAALRPRRVNLAELVDKAIADLSRETAADAVQWKIGALPDVHADPVFLSLALRNLLSNAVKYSRGRQPAIVHVDAETSADGVTTHVRDNGVGFNMKYVDKLFGIFQRLHRVEDFEGTGIGLANVKRIIERHGGQVWAQGEPDHGAVFSFSLPHANSPTLLQKKADAEAHSPG